MTTQTSTGSSRPPRRAAAQRLLGSYLLRVLEERSVQVSVVYELHDLASGERLRFATRAGMERHLARQPGVEANRRTP